MRNINDVLPEEWDRVSKIYADMAAEEQRVSAPVDFKANQGVTKPKLELVPLSALTYAAIGLQEGARKYGSASWRDVESVDLAQYIGATLRHLLAYADGEDTDPESGNPHLAHALASLCIMIDLIENGNGVDTRPTEGNGPLTLSKYTERKS